MMIDRHQRTRRGPAFRASLARNVTKARSNYIMKSIESTGKDFCKETTIHGCRFIVEHIDKHGNNYVRQFRRAVSLMVWVPVVSFGAAFAIYLMILVWNRYQNTPTITTIETNNYPIWKVPFPGVTICNVNSVYKPNTRNITLELLNRGFSSAGIELFFQSLAALVNFREVDSAFLRISQALEELGYTTEKLMFQLAQPCENLIKECSWLGKVVPCNTLFRLAKSASGFCCSFNYKALRSSLEIETKEDDYYQINAPVIRISGAGEDVGLILLLDVEIETYVAPKRYFYGTEVIIHDAEDFPEQGVLSAFAQPGDEVSAAVVPSVVVTEASAETLPTSLRFCRFSNEKPLRITKKYSFQSCMTECRADSIIEKCGCLPFFFPPIHAGSTSNGVRYEQCSLKDVKCLSDNKHFFSSIEPDSNEDYNFNMTNVGMSCDCLPSCSEQVYDVKTFVSRRFQDLNRTFLHFQSHEVSSNLTLLKVYFKDLTCIKYRREIFMTWDDMLASFGGIFGLCLGGSVLSIIELAYYATFKFYAKVLSNKVKLDEKRRYENNQHEMLINFNKVRFSPVNRQKKPIHSGRESFFW